MRQFSLTDWCSVRPCIRGNELLNEVNGLLKSSGRSPLHPASTSALVHGLTLAQVIGKVTGVNEAKAWVGHNLDHIVQIAESFYNQSRANRQSKAKSR